MSDRSGRTASVTPENSPPHEAVNASEVNRVRGVGRPPRGRGRRVVTPLARRSSSVVRRGRGRPRGNAGKRLNDEEFRATINEEVTRALQAALPEVIAQVRQADKNEQEDRTSEANTKTRTVPKNTGNTESTKTTRNEESNMDTEPEDEESESLNEVGRKKKGCNYKSFSACHPPIFNGEGDAIITMKWIREMESVIETSNCADEEAVKYAVHSFKSEALFWWDNVKDVRGPAAIRKMTWKKFKEILMEKFCPEGEINQLEQEFLTLEQGNMSMREYTTRFNESKPHCKKCNRAHSGECKLGTNSCYKCGDSGHMSRDCPQWSCYNCGGSGHVKFNCPSLKKGATGNLQITDGKSDKSGGIPNAKGRAYIMTTEEAKETPDVVSGKDKASSSKGKAV